MPSDKIQEFSNRGGGNSYLRTLYGDMESKQKSIAKYQEKSRETLQKLHQMGFEWIRLLEKKFEVIDKFRKSRDRIVPSHFAVEKAPGTANQDNQQTDIKKMEQAIKDANNQINYLFAQATKDLEVQTQSYQELQSLVTQIYDQFQEIYSDSGM